jgi:hypothetical protein
MSTINRVFRPVGQRPVINHKVVVKTHTQSTLQGGPIRWSTQAGRGI